MSKKFLPILIVAALLLVAIILALPKDAAASELLGITPTTPPPTTPPPTTPPPTTPPPTTPPPTTPPPTTPPPTTPPPTTEVPATTEPPPSTDSSSKPKKTEVVLLPATGESPTNPSLGMQWFFALTMIFVIGIILIRTVVGAKIKK